MVLGSESHTSEYNRPGGQGRLRVGGASIYNRIPASYMYKLEENNLNTGCSHTFNNLDLCFNTWSLFSSLCHTLAQTVKAVCSSLSVYSHSQRRTWGFWFAYGEMVG